MTHPFTKAHLTAIIHNLETEFFRVREENAVHLRTRAALLKDVKRLKAVLSEARNEPRLPICANCDGHRKTEERLAKVLLAEWAQDEYGPDDLVEAAEVFKRELREAREKYNQATHSWNAVQASYEVVCQERDRLKAENKRLDDIYPGCDEYDAEMALRRKEAG